ncbi:hypothetical protein [Streptomyces bacillaris]|uniref:hypothetical protein n=1 Tax=Streptomyces bacillaris TaxID=68179 RepID=UPI00364B1056
MSLPRVFDALDAEWALVCAVPGRAAVVRGWLRKCGALPEGLDGGLEDVLPELTRQERVQGRSLSDRWLYSVLRKAGGEGEEAQLAARLVVQAMLPAAVRLTRRLQAGRDFDETAQVVVSCLYRVVRTYPMARRSRVSANVVLETLHWASRELAAEAGSGSVAWCPELESSVSDRVLLDAGDPAEEAWRCVLGQQAERLGFAAGAEELAGARGELVELLVWAVSAGQLDVERARVIVARSGRVRGKLPSRRGCLRLRGVSGAAGPCGSCGRSRMGGCRPRDWELSSFSADGVTSWAERLLGVCTAGFRREEAWRDGRAMSGRWPVRRAQGLWTWRCWCGPVPG